MSLDYPYHLSRLLPLSIKIYGQQAKYCLSETQHCQNPMFQQFFLQRSIFNMLSFAVDGILREKELRPTFVKGNGDVPLRLILCSQRSDFTCNCASLHHLCGGWTQNMHIVCTGFCPLVVWPVLDDNIFQYFTFPSTLLDLDWAPCPPRLLAS